MTQNRLISAIFSLIRMCYNHLSKARGKSRQKLKWGSRFETPAFYVFDLCCVFSSGRVLVSS